MAVLEVFLIGGSLTLLFVSGWVFLQQSLYKELDDGETFLQARVIHAKADRRVPSVRLTLAVFVQGIFSLVFALSVNLVELILFEILGFLPYRWNARHHCQAVGTLTAACS